MAARSTTSGTTLTDLYRRELRRQGFRADAAQEKAVTLLEQLRAAIVEEAAGKTSRSRLRQLLSRGAHTATGSRGIYLWGGVGRGKTWLMDLFHDSIPPSVTHQRSHFHHFMRDVHQQLGGLKKQSAPLERVARGFAERGHVLCLDELFVNDIGDAMILGTLFESLLAQGVWLCITSNLPPHQLYRDGLQRARFLPAIALLESRLTVHELDGGTDYRLRQLQQAPIYVVNADREAARAQLARLFERLTGGHGEHAAELRVAGRPVAAWRRSSDVVWFDFATLCEGARSQNDYVEIADEFHTVFVSDVPQFTTPQHDDAARRFVALVDEFYDRGVKLVLSAATTADQLYQAERLRFEFQRTSSRLIEMQSEAYLARAHRG